MEKYEISDDDKEKVKNAIQEALASSKIDAEYDITVSADKVEGVNDSINTEITGAKGM